MQPRNPSLNDFDGTLTTLAGGALVITKAYNNVVINDELRQIIAVNRDAFAQLDKEIAVLVSEKDHVSTQLSDLQFAHTPDIQPLANSGEYQPLNLSGSYTTMDLSTSGELNPALKELSMRLAALESRIAVLTEQKKQYPAAPYTIMGDQNLNPDQIRARSHEILEKIKQQPNKDVYQLADGAKEYLLALLSDDTTPAYIISRNHEEYIRAVLLFNGFSEQQIDQIDIHDLRKGGGNKYASAGNILQNFPAGSVVIIADDDRNDNLKMQRAAQECGMRIISRTQPAGQFYFPGILQEFAETLKAKAKKARSSENALRVSGMWKRSSENAKQPVIESPSALKKSRGGDGE